MRKVLSIVSLMLLTVTYILPFSSIELDATEISPAAAGDCYSFVADSTNQAECNGSIQDPNFDDPSAWQSVDGTPEISGGVANISSESIYQDIVFNGGEKFYIVVSGKDDGHSDDIYVETGAPGPATKDDTVKTTGNEDKTNVLSEVYSASVSDASTNVYGRRQYLLEIPESDGPITVRIRVASTGNGEVLMKSVDDSGAAKYDMETSTTFSSDYTEFTQTSVISRLDGEDLRAPVYTSTFNYPVFNDNVSDFDITITHNGTDVTSKFTDSVAAFSNTELTLSDFDGVYSDELVVEISGSIYPDVDSSYGLDYSSISTFQFDSESGEEANSNLPFYLINYEDFKIDSTSDATLTTSISEPTDEIADEDELVTLTLDLEHESGYYIVAPEFEIVFDDISDIDTSTISLDNSDYTFTISGDTLTVVSANDKFLSPGEADQINISFNMSSSFSSNKKLNTDTTYTSYYYDNKDINDSANIDLGIKPVITANDFTVDSEETLDQDSAISYAEANAENEYTGEAYDITVDETQLTAINDSDFGLYPLTFTTIEDENVEVNVLVANDDTTSSSTEALNAYDFTVSIDDAATLTSTDIDTLSEVQAISLADGSSISATLTSDAADVITEINNSQGGLYVVTYETESGALTKDVYITVDPGDDSLSGNTLIVADDFQYNNSNELDSNNAIDLANSIATNIKDGSDVDVVVDATELAEINNATPGYYPLTFTSDNKDAATITVKVLVYNDDTNLNLEDGEMLYSEGIIISSEEASKLDDSEFLELTGSVAYDIIEEEDMGVVVSEESQDDYNLILDGQIGFYTLTLETETGNTKTTINVVVYGEEGNLDLDTGEYINAEAITVKSEEIKGVTESELVEQANASAFNIYTGEELDVEIAAVSSEEFNSIQAGTEGEYNVTYVTETGKTNYVETVEVTDQIIQITGLNTNIFAILVTSIIALALFRLKRTV